MRPSMLRLNMITERFPRACRVLWALAGFARRAVAPGAPAGVTGKAPAEVQAALASEGLGAALATGTVAVLGPGAGEVASALRAAGVAARRVAQAGEVAIGTSVVVAGPERLSPRTLRTLLAALHDAELVVVCPPLWPQARALAFAGQGTRTLRTRSWWDTLAAAAGLAPAVEFRLCDGDRDVLVFEPLRSQGRNQRIFASRPTRSVAARNVAIRVHDDLSVGCAFSWCSASIALALDDLGVPVSVAPTAISPSFGAERRARLQGLIERVSPARTVDAELGWTHYWPQYRRKLGGRVSLPLFAINYRFARRELNDFDPWMRDLVQGQARVVPISGFCRDVLHDAGMALDRLPVVPMAFTEGLADQPPGVLPRARAVRLLHTTNAFDSVRNGTDLALDAFAQAFTPGDDVTLVVRDYASWSPSLAERIAGLRVIGWDVRYWPVFFPEQRLGRFLRAFDAMLAPFRGEGFGIKVLDAMACGVPAICPFFGGPNDFVDDLVAYEVAYDLVPVSGGYDAEQTDLGNEPQWAECRIVHLVDALRAVASDRAEVGRRGAAARERALGQFSWHDTARRIVEVVDEATSSVD